MSILTFLNCFKMEGAGKKLKRGRIIIEQGLADLVLSLYKEGLSINKIASYLKRQKGVSVSPTTIANFLKLYNEIKDFRVAEAVKKSLKEAEDIDIKAFESMIVGLKLVAKLQKDVMDDPSLSLSQKTMILDRLNRTRLSYSESILKIYKELGFKELLDSIFERLGTDLGLFFRGLSIDGEVIKGVSEILQRVYEDFKKKFEVEKR